MMINETIKRILSSIIILPVALFFIIKGTYFFLFFISVFLIVNIYEWFQMSKKRAYLLPGIIFLFFSSYTAYLLRGNTNNDLIIFLIVILVCVSTDIGGYVFGKLFKGPKLIKISPNKTYSGMFGGFFLSLITINIYYLYFENININETFINEVDIKMFIVVILISSISQAGDLFISYFKRISKIKNTGKIIPGHGGLLDRVDGMIFAIPFSYLLFKLIY